MAVAYVGVRGLRGRFGDLPGGGSPSEEVTVFGAASLTDALHDVADVYSEAHPGSSVVLNLAASSTLAPQIEAGAPADVFISANEAWAAHVAEQGFLAEAPVPFLTNRLVVVGADADASIQQPAELRRVRRLAVGDPSHVPAGLYARQALACEGMWEDMQPALVPALNVRAALLAVQTGAADAAIVYATAARGAGVEANVLFIWPDTCQLAIRYVVGLPRQGDASDAARTFLSFALDVDRHGLWRKAGFEPISRPTEAQPLASRGMAAGVILAFARAFGNSGLRLYWPVTFPAGRDPAPGYFHTVESDRRRGRRDSTGRYCGIGIGAEPDPICLADAPLVQPIQVTRESPSLFAIQLPDDGERLYRWMKNFRLNQAPGAATRSLPGIQF